MNAHVRPLASFAVSAALSLAFTTTTLAEGIRFDPPAPDSHTYVYAVVGMPVNGCYPHDPTISRNGSEVVIHYPNPWPAFGSCPSMKGAWTDPVPLGTLSPGTWKVTALLDDYRGVTGTIASTTLQVRDGESRIAMIPSGAPTTGGSTVIVLAKDGLPSAVTFGDVSVPATQMPNVPAGWLFAVAVNPPAHAAGPVDVWVQFGPTRAISRSSFIYYDPSAAVDRSVFEPVLFPIAFQGPGAYGSQWRTDNAVDTAEWPTIFRSPLPCTMCSTTVSGPLRFEGVNSASGLLLWLARTGGPSLFAGSRIRDTTRSAITQGTAVPVVRENDFRFTSVKLLDVPYDAGSRYFLRVWALGNPEGIASVTGYTQSAAVFNGAVTLLATDPEQSDVEKKDFWYGGIDVTPAVQSAKAGETTSFRIVPGGSDPSTRIWAMLSITNNDTQQVTIVAPR